MDVCETTSTRRPSSTTLLSREPLIPNPSPRSEGRRENGERHE
jgi:hypothetical protein